MSGVNWTLLPLMGQVNPSALTERRNRLAAMRVVPYNLTSSRHPSVCPPSWRMGRCTPSGWSRLNRPTDRDLWRQTRDGLFLLFAIAFGVDAAMRLLLGLSDVSAEQEPFFYMARLVTFGLIIVAIVQKNRLRKPSR